MPELAAKAAEVCGEGQGREQRPGSVCWVWIRLLGRKREDKGCAEIPEHFCSQGLNLVLNPEHLSSQCLPTVLDRRVILENKLMDHWMPCGCTIMFTHSQIKIRLNFECSFLTYLP